MSERKTTFYWASVAGADPEPVEFVEIDGRKAVFTCGCGDPFFLDDPECPVRLGRQFAGLLIFGSSVPIVRPVIASKQEAARIASQYKEASRPGHSWRGPR
jgi:hypothetical protein